MSVARSLSWLAFLISLWYAERKDYSETPHYNKPFPFLACKVYQGGRPEWCIRSGACVVTADVSVNHYFVWQAEENGRLILGCFFP